MSILFNEILGMMIYSCNVCSFFLFFFSIFGLFFHVIFALSSSVGWRCYRPDFVLCNQQQVQEICNFDFIFFSPLALFLSVFLCGLCGFIDVFFSHHMADDLINNGIYNRIRSYFSTIQCCIQTLYSVHKNTRTHSASIAFVEHVLKGANKENRRDIDKQ